MVMICALVKIVKSAGLMRGRAGEGGFGGPVVVIGRFAHHMVLLGARPAGGCGRLAFGRIGGPTFTIVETASSAVPTGVFHCCPGPGPFLNR